MAVAVANPQLCADLELAFERLPGLTAVTEVGIGLNHGVQRAARHHEVGYLWHEKRPGVHIGMGAITSTSCCERRVRAGGTVLLEWD